MNQPLHQRFHILSFVFLVAALSQQLSAMSGTVRGTVTLQGAADNAGAIVTIAGRNLFTLSDTSGYFSIGGVASGPLRIQAGKLFFRNAAIDTVLADAETLSVAMVLSNNIADTQQTMTTASILTSLSNMGNLGTVNVYVDTAEVGFRWRGNQVLREASLMIGTDTNRVSDAARFIFGIAQNNLDHDFQSLSDVIIRTEGPDSTVLLTSFDDSRSNFPPGIPSRPLGVRIVQETFGFGETGFDGMLLIKLTMENTTSAELTELLAGYFIDWSIGPDPNTNRGAILTVQNQIDGINGNLPFDVEIAVQRDSTAGSPLMGVVPLGQAQFKAARIASINREIVPSAPNNGMTEGNKYRYLRDRRPDSPAAEFGIPEDLAMIVSVGGISGGSYASSTLTLPGFSSRVIGFALVGGDDSLELVTNALNAQRKWITLGNVMDIPTGVREDPGSTPGIFSVTPAYPNPFNPVTTIGIELKERAFVTISIYSFLGQKVGTIINAWKEAGHHNLMWDASNLSSGVYVYQVVAGEHSATGRAVLIK